MNQEAWNRIKYYNKQRRLCPESYNMSRKDIYEVYCNTFKRGEAPPIGHVQEEEISGGRLFDMSGDAERGK